MLRKDKALLERLTRKYGRNYILNEISYELAKRARDKAEKDGRTYQKMYFKEEVDKREKRELDNILSNLSLELFFDYYGYGFYVDKNYPIAVGVNGEDQIMISVGEEIYPFFKDDTDYLANYICDTLNIDINDIGYIDVDRVAKNINDGDVIYWGLCCDVTKKMARDFANFGKAVNERFGIYWLEEDWHQIYNHFWELNK
jgi:hypothetical protein